MDMLVQLIGTDGTGQIENLGSADKNPRGVAICLCNDVIRNTIPARMPTSRNLPCIKATEAEVLETIMRAPFLNLMNY